MSSISGMPVRSVRVRTPSATWASTTPGNHSRMRSGAARTPQTSSALRWMRAWLRSVAIHVPFRVTAMRSPRVSRRRIAFPAVPLPPSIRARARELATTAVHRSWLLAKRHGLVTPRHPLSGQFRSMGEGSWIAFPPGDYVNAHAVSIGRNCVLGADVTLAVGMPTEVYPADCEPVIEFGDRTTVGKSCWFVAREKIVLEEDVTLAPNVYITDHNHTYADPWLPVGQQILQCEPVRVGAGTWIGTNVVVLPGRRHRPQLRHRRRHRGARHHPRPLGGGRRAGQGRAELDRGRRLAAPDGQAGRGAPGLARRRAPADRRPPTRPTGLRRRLTSTRTRAAGLSRR